MISLCLNIYILDFSGGSLGKNPPASVGDPRDVGLIPGSGRSPGGGHGNLLQYSCLENATDGGTWQAAVHSVAESDKTEAIEHSTNIYILHYKLLYYKALSFGAS